MNGSAIALAILLAAVPALSRETIPPTEKAALITFFQSTGGSGWTDHKGWLTTDDPCDWPGVMCGWTTSQPNRPVVIGLGLGFSNLTGELPSSALRDRPNLQTFDVRGNRLTGEIPEEWLERWDRNDFELFLWENRFSNLVQRVRIQLSSPSVLCAFDEDARYFVELDESGSAHFESIRCASRNPGSRATTWLVKDGEAPSLTRLSRALKRIGFEKLDAEYSYPFTFATHQIYVTTTVWYGDGHFKTLQTYGGQGPIEAFIVEQLVWGLVEQVTWTRQSKKKQCAF